VPSGARSGGDLAAVFSCSDNIARVVLADCVGHGCIASGLARHIHRLLDKFQDIRNTGGFLAALNTEFTLHSEESDGPLRMTTVVTAAFDAATGEFNFAYAAHPRMLLRRARDSRFYEIGQELQNFPLGFVAEEQYLERSIHLDPGDMIVAFSDGATEVESPGGVQLTAVGFAEFAATTLSKFAEPLSLPEFSKALLDGIHEYHGGADLEDDITLLTLRRSPLLDRGEDGRLCQ
jgi:serine phosphatase RsbU (regulator of sigma subunit)